MNRSATPQAPTARPALFILPWLALSCPPADALDFMNGVDISALTALENDGAVYRDANGTPGDAITILRDEGIDWYRLRLFVNPNHQGLVVNDLNYTTQLAQRVKAAGGNVLIDFHYSDTWADPGNQTKPAAWTGLNFTQLTDRVRTYTRDVVDHLQANGAMPDAVQIGNEITSGMLWNDGRLYVNPGQREQEFDRLATLLDAGLTGVDEAASDGVKPLTMIHIADGSNAGGGDYFFGELAERELDFDMIGYSYYPRWHGTFSELENNLQQTAATFGKPVVLAEIGFAYSGPQWEPQADQFLWEVTPEGQADYTQDVVDALLDLPDELGAGAFWWHAAATRSDNWLAWEGGRLGLFDTDGRVLPAAGVLGDAAHAVSLEGDYDGSGQVEQGDLDLVLQNWGQTDVSSVAAWISFSGLPGDNIGGQVEQTELDLVLQNWGVSSAPDFKDSTVPEPALVGVFGCLVWRIPRHHRVDAR